MVDPSCTKASGLTGRAQIVEETAIKDLLSQVPVMPATILALDLLLQERSVDLCKVANILMNDLGATLCASSSTENDLDARPHRLTDSIARMELHELVDMLACHMSCRPDKPEASRQVAGPGRLRFRQQSKRSVTLIPISFAPHDSSLRPSNSKVIDVF